MESRQLVEKQKLVDKVKGTCYTILFENRYQEFSDTFGYFYHPKINPIQVEEVSENIALWSIVCSPLYHNPFGNKDKKMYFYTDVNGDLLFDNRFFDYATPFSDGCAFIQVKGFEDWKPVKKSLILDVKRHQLLSVPIDFKAVDRVVNNNIPFLDTESKKWGSCVINPETGEWNYDIPFIWDGLSFSSTTDRVYVGIVKSFSYYPNWDNTPYCRMVPDWDKAESYHKYSITSMSKKYAYTLDSFRESDGYGHCALRNDFWDYVRSRDIFGSGSLDSVDSNNVVDAGNIEEYTYKKSYVANSRN